jgi:urease accessory protein
VHAIEFNLPLSDKVIAASVIAAGWLIAAGHANRQPVWMLLAAAAGLFHGYAFGETVIGAERGVIGAYLAGLAVAMTLVAAAVMLMASQMLRLADAKALPVRVTGLAVTAVGVGMLALKLV